jgi:hypothetical protein
MVDFHAPKLSLVEHLILVVSVLRTVYIALFSENFIIRVTQKGLSFLWFRWGQPTLLVLITGVYSFAWNWSLRKQQRALYLILHSCPCYPNVQINWDFVIQPAAEPVCRPKSVRTVRIRKPLFYTASMWASFPERQREEIIDRKLPDHR